jgi:tetratricopeptide (TPR) repeat protein
MKSSSFSKTLLGLLLAGLLISPNLARAQDADYTEDEYNVYKSIHEEKDAAKKTDMIIKFLQENKTSLRTNVSDEFAVVVKTLVAEKKWKELLTICEKYLKFAPADSNAIYGIAAGYSGIGDDKGYATFAEKAYASKPSGELALEIAKSYLRLKNEAKFLQWAEKGLSSDPANILILSEMMRQYAVNENKEQELKYANKCLQVLPTAKKPEGFSDKDFKGVVSNTYATAYGIIGANDFENNRFRETITNLENSIKYYKTNGGAYYRLGMSYWQLSKIAEATQNFAKCVVLKQDMAAQAKKQLEKIWSSTHKNTLDGLDKLYDFARQSFK